MNEHFVSARDESVRMFRQNGLERLTHVHPAIPHLIDPPLIAALLWWAPTPPLTDVWLLATGLAVWTAVEYALHRHLFHAPDAVMRETHEVVGRLAASEPVIPRLPGWRHVVYFIMHGVHHEYPNDSSRLVMAPPVSIPMAALFAASFRLAVGAHWWAALFAGFLVGYLVYDSMHYAAHHRSMRTALGRYTKWRHFRHHFTDPDRDYGVSSPVWDWIMGTLSRRSRSAQAAHVVARAREVVGSTDEGSIRVSIEARRLHQ